MCGGRGLGHAVALGNDAVEALFHLFCEIELQGCCAGENYLQAGQVEGIDSRMLGQANRYRWCDEGELSLVLGDDREEVHEVELAHGVLRRATPQGQVQECSQAVDVEERQDGHCRSVLGQCLDSCCSCLSHVGNKIAMRELDALWHTSGARRKRNHGNIIG